MPGSRKIREALWRRAGYLPSPEQLAAHDSKARIRLIGGGERAGKSRSAAMELFGRFEGWQIEHVSREQNRRADALARERIKADAAHDKAR